MPKGYIIARIDVTDPQAYEQYRIANAVPFAKYKARFLVRGGTANSDTHTLLENWSLPAPIIAAVTSRTLGSMDQNSMGAILWCADRMARSRVLVEAIYADEEPPLPISLCSDQRLPDAFFTACSIAPHDAARIEARVGSQVQALRSMAAMFAQIH